ncbi:uncharacterized protein N7459_005960 [Penicillium hispanicum]|uniref:uncharacterized protein n=1 Tax=Penicillium hispanicum TaxID=1080232 RepID=UPI002540E288|nr:uncharacterized protein N7459_005960 [Penicillium hispanicum]KAJ5579975.1 hypothetical protein N7459_005960 [Penicillium hispanicum]
MAPPPTLGFIWPKDPRPGNPPTWPRRWRLFDLLTNKGPDIYVGVLRHNTPTGPKKAAKTHWTRWEPEAHASRRAAPWARRPDAQRYDFRQRKYVVPDHGTWSAVQYCSAKGAGGLMRVVRGERHRVPRRYWDRNGEEYPANQWHDMIYGVHAD